MSDHTEIPADVMEAANNAAFEAYDKDTETWFDVRDVIARAILAERERAARIVHKRVGHGYLLDEINGVER